MIQVQVSQDEPSNGPYNMAQDVRLLDLAKQGIVAGRIYSWTGPWVSLGKFQIPADVMASSIPYVVRPTGGKAVYHGHDVTVGLAVPLSVIQCSERDVKKAYRAICAPLIEALNGCGMTAGLAENTKHAGSGSKTEDCFAFNSPNDIVDIYTGKKVCGCALLMTSFAVLIQASIPNGAPELHPKFAIKGAADWIGVSYDLSRLAVHLEEALRYNFSNVSA